MTETRAATPAIDVRRITRRFGSVTAVDHLSLTVARGQIYGLLGSNGAGKTTLVKMLTTLLPPSEGEAFVAGASILAAPAEVRRRIGYVPQMLSADGMLTARENLLFSARLYDVPAGERSRRIADALRFMELVEAADRLVKTYSGGMVRRLELAQAMLHRPVVIRANASWASARC
jgi:ABC-2 type transport system ATP-binding protein